MEPTEETKIKAILDRVVANKAYTKNDLQFLSNRYYDGYRQLQNDIKYLLDLPKYPN